MISNLDHHRVLRSGRLALATSVALAAAAVVAAPADARIVDPFSSDTEVIAVRPGVTSVEFDIAHNPERDEFLVAFQERFPSTVQHAITIVRLDADGDLLSGPTVVASESEADDFDNIANGDPAGPSVAYNPQTDQYLVAYVRDTGSGPTQTDEIHGRLVSDLGAPVGGEVNIEPPVTRDFPLCKQIYPEVVWDGAGGYVLVASLQYESATDGLTCGGLTPFQHSTVVQRLSGSLALGAQRRIAPDAGSSGVGSEATAIARNPVTGTFLVGRMDTGGLSGDGVDAFVLDGSLSTVAKVALPGDQVNDVDVAADPESGNWLVGYVSAGEGTRLAVLGSGGSVVAPSAVYSTQSVEHVAAMGDGTYSMITTDRRLHHLGPDGSQLDESGILAFNSGTGLGLAARPAPVTPGVFVVSGSPDAAADPSVAVRTTIAPGSVSLVPARLADTRTGPGAETIDGEFQGIGRRAAGSTLELDVAGRGGVPAGADSALLNITSAQATGVGFLTAYPCDESRPNTSNLNYAAGPASSSAAFVKLSATGQVCIYVSTDSQLIVDVNGYVPGVSSTRSIVPERFLETRPGTPTTVDGTFHAAGKQPAGQPLELLVAGRGAVPADAQAAIINVTAVQPDDRTFITVYPCGSTRPNASNLNAEAGQNLTNVVVAKIGTGGRVCVYSSARTHLIVDVSAYVPAGGGIIATDPARLLETRAGPGIGTVDGVRQGEGPLGPGAKRVQIAGRGPIPSEATGVLLNVGAIRPADVGYMSVYPSCSQQPNASNVNFAAGDIVSNAVFVQLAGDGALCLFSSVPSEAIIDVVGYVLD